MLSLLLIIYKAVMKSSPSCSDARTESRGGLGGWDGVVVFPRADTGRTEIRSWMGVVLAGFWMHFKGERGGIA